MYTLQPGQPATAKKRNNIGCLVIAGLITVISLTIGVATAPYRTPAQVSKSIEFRSPKTLAAGKALAAQVELQAKAWNDGMVHV